jgi:hypothetical protein
MVQARLYGVNVLQERKKNRDFRGTTFNTDAQLMLRKPSFFSSLVNKSLRIF